MGGMGTRPVVLLVTVWPLFQWSDDAFAVVNLDTVVERFRQWRRMLPRVKVIGGSMPFPFPHNLWNSAFLCRQVQQ